MNTDNHQKSQESGQPGQTVAELIQDMRELTLALDSFTLSFTLAWMRNSGPQRQPSSPATTTPLEERTSQ